jgi:hypothetical protein
MVWSKTAAAQRGTGDVGPAVEVRATERPFAGVLHAHRRLDPRPAQTIFGEITVGRTGYCQTGAATIYPLDAQLQLPHRSSSYELQRRLVQAATQGPFAEATARVAEATRVAVPKRRSPGPRSGPGFRSALPDAYPPPEAETGPTLVAALDGKGVPMVKGVPARHMVRRAKREMAQQPRLRTSQAVFEHLFGPEPRRSPEAGASSDLPVSTLNTSACGPACSRAKWGSWPR